MTFAQPVRASDDVAQSHVHIFADNIDFALVREDLSYLKDLRRRAGYQRTLFGSECCLLMALDSDHTVSSIALR